MLPLPADSYLVVDNNATLNLGGLSFVDTPLENAYDALQGVTLNDGTITNGTLGAWGLFEVGNGSISANLTGKAPLLESLPCNAVVQPGNVTVMLSGSSNSYTGGTYIIGGMLEFSLQAPSIGQITIESGGELAAAGCYTTANAWLSALNNKHNRRFLAAPDQLHLRWRVGYSEY